MNEGKALVGKLCRFGQEKDELYWLGICTKADGGDNFTYYRESSGYYKHAEAITVTPVEIKDEPTHKVIMTHWWLTTLGRWKRVDTYHPGEDKPYAVIGNGGCGASWFSDREHAEIPPG
jgi:hypothetical protein